MIGRRGENYWRSTILPIVTGDGDVKWLIHRIEELPDSTKTSVSAKQYTAPDDEAAGVLPAKKGLTTNTGVCEQNLRLQGETLDNVGAGFIVLDGNWSIRFANHEAAGISGTHHLATLAAYNRHLRGAAIFSLHARGAAGAPGACFR